MKLKLNKPNAHSDMRLVRKIANGNYHAGPANPQFIEFTKEKKVGWTFRDLKSFGNSSRVACPSQGRPNQTLQQTGAACSLSPVHSRSSGPGC